MSDEENGNGGEDPSPPDGPSKREISLVWEVSVLRTRQDELLCWMNQQKGSENYRRYVFPILFPLLISVVLGLMAFFYNGISNRLESISEEFYEYRLLDTERAARMEKDLEAKKGP